MWIVPECWCMTRTSPEQWEPRQGAGHALLCCAVPWHWHPPRHLHSSAGWAAWTPGAGPPQPLSHSCSALEMLWLWTQRNFPENSHSYSSTRQKESFPPQLVLSEKAQCPSALTWHVGSCVPKTFPGRGAEASCPSWEFPIKEGFECRKVAVLLRNSSVLWKI